MKEEVCQTEVHNLMFRQEIWIQRARERDGKVMGDDKKL